MKGKRIIGAGPKLAPGHGLPRSAARDAWQATSPSKLRHRGRAPGPGAAQPARAKRRPVHATRAIITLRPRVAARSAVAPVDGGWRCKLECWGRKAPINLTRVGVLQWSGAARSGGKNSSTRWRQTVMACCRHAAVASGLLELQWLPLQLLIGEGGVGVVWTGLSTVRW
jgi:hypothetical protein